MASTPLFDAASSSWTSSDDPAAISVHDMQTPQGSPSTGLTQLSAFARIRAVDVLPVPRGPLKNTRARHGPRELHSGAQG